MSTNPQDGSRPTVVLVHGAFADGSSWNEVIERLQVKDLQVTAPSFHCLGIAIDSAYISAFSSRFQAQFLPSALHGGAIFTNAATNANNVVGLVYVCAFAPAEGET